MPAAELGAQLWTGDRLRALPAGLVMGLPVRLTSVARSRVLSTRGILRAGLEVALPRRPVDNDLALGELVSSRLGREALERLVEPLLGGIYAGDASRLSLRATLPDVYALVRQRRSLVLGLRSGRAGAGSRSLVSLPGGLGTLVDRLVATLGSTEVRRVPAMGIARQGSRYRVDLAEGAPITAEGIILATPAFAGAEIVGRCAPAAADLLRGIEYASVATVALVFPPDLALPSSTGFLVPRAEGKLLVGCTYVSVKWPTIAGSGHTVIRCAVGRAGDERWRSMSDDQLVAGVLDELEQAHHRPFPELLARRVTRWDRALPQYTVGHVDRVDAIRENLATLLPGISVAGAAYSGIGIAACITQARVAAEQVLGHLL